MKRSKLRSKAGVNMPEFAAVLCFGLPLLTVLVFVTLEITRFFTIKSAMEVGARNAARALVVDYNKTNVKNDSDSLTWCRVPNYIADNGQFQVAWDETDANRPKFVTVTCTYPNDGAYGLNKFPGGPLNYLFKESTFNLSNIQVKGTFTVPVQ